MSPLTSLDEIRDMPLSIDLSELDAAPVSGKYHESLTRSFHVVKLVRHMVDCGFIAE